MSEVVEHKARGTSRTSRVQDRMMPDTAGTVRDEDPIENLQMHCEMFLYGSAGPSTLLFDKAAADFFHFAGLHLMTTMFIASDEPGGAAGVFHRILDPMGRASLLTDVDHILDSPIGETTLRRYIANKCDALATHGRLNWGSQAPEVHAVDSDDAKVAQVDDAICALVSAVGDLADALALLQSHA